MTSRRGRRPDPTDREKIRVSELRPHVDDRARAAIDTVGFPVSVTCAVRDRDGRLLDFRLEAVNLAAAAWAGLDRAAVHGRLVTDLLPGLRPTGLFDELDRVVTTGRPFRQVGHYSGVVEAGRPFDGDYEVFVIRHGDGYVCAWAERDESARPRVDLDVALRPLRAAIPLVRLEVSPLELRPRPAT